MSLLRVLAFVAVGAALPGLLLGQDSTAADTGRVTKRDGSVEAFAEGPAGSVEDFKHDLATGPQWAVVDQVEEIVLEPTGTYSAFRIER